MTWLERNGSRFGMTALPLLAIGSYLALSWSPPDIHMGQDLRLLYIHVPTIWTGYIAFTITLIASVMVLWKKDLRWDDLAVASAEIGVVLTALAIIAGAIWGKLTWGVFWTWDPRLTSTAVLVVIFAGYLLLRALSDDTWVRARISAVVAIIGFIDIPVVHFSVLWWRSLHQGPTFLQPNLGDPTMDDRMELTLIVNTVAFTLLLLFLLSKRLELARLERKSEEVDWTAETNRTSELEPAHAR
ncbi:MAG TPA: cytochrome c biogenesis protein CcsA [Chloroflexota bacterium]|jgi:heme exporter protein C|nr:cytochrome c biogenesis protein CcsA [Chloroflexota bacterium]